MKFAEEIESVQKAARRMHERLHPGSGGDVYDHNWAAGVEDALIWAQGKGTSDRMKQLESDADWRQEVENSIPSDALIQARDLLGRPSDLSDVNPEYQRAVLEMVSRLAGLDTDSSEIVADLLGLDHDKVYPKPPLETRAASDR